MFGVMKKDLISFFFDKNETTTTIMNNNDNNCENYQQSFTFWKTKLFNFFKRKFFFRRKRV